MKRFLVLLTALALALGVFAARAEFNLEEGEIDEDAEPQIWYAEGILYEDIYAYNMVVVNCDEWVSLRAEPSKSSERLAKVPLGAVVADCLYPQDGFISCSYEGVRGYILEEYLEPIIEEYEGIGEYPLSDFVGRWQVSVEISRVGRSYALSAVFYRLASFDAIWIEGDEYAQSWQFITYDGACVITVEPMAGAFLLTVDPDKGAYGDYFDTRVFVCIPMDEAEAE